MMEGLQDIQPAGGKNVDGSWFDEIVRGKSRVDWDDLFHDDNTGFLLLGRMGVDDTCRCNPYLGILNALCFLDALTPTHVGPDMGPRFNEPAPMEYCTHGFGFFR